jgi:hypothetical protein
MTSVYPSRMLNAAYLGEYADRNSAMLRVENDIQHQMEMVLHDWKLYRAAKGGDLAGRKGVCIEVRQGG